VKHFTKMGEHYDSGNTGYRSILWLRNDLVHGGAEMKHTPGPWRAEGWSDLIVNSEEGYTIVACPGGGPNCTLEESQANARLIAAAPRGLALLQKLYEHEAYGTVLTPSRELCLEEVEKLLRQVRGE
jgi:hypothetical protein